ncbi:MAG: hypothetical protein GXP55_23060, partial [Deltaproteobacteria bacterium]|nr:hypothetical protein [Deltaproteobacteria bacterium]
IVERARRDDAWEPDQDAAMAAVVALGALPGADARRALEGFAQSEDTNLRALAQRALAEPRRCR